MHLEEFERGGYRFRAYTEDDDYNGAPWENEDGHGPVRKANGPWSGYASKRPGERPLNAPVRGEYWFLYDVQEAQRIALRDGWDAEPLGTGTKRQQAARAVAADFERMRAWVAGEWGYIGVTLEYWDEERGDWWHTGGSLWGVESDTGDYLDEVARELADEFIAKHGEKSAAQEDEEEDGPDVLALMRDALQTIAQQDNKVPAWMLARDVLEQVSR